jgi:hypothetical protein
VQKPVSKVLRTDNFKGSKMDEATKRFFQELVTNSGERTAKNIKEQNVLMIEELNKHTKVFAVEIANLKKQLEQANWELRKKNIAIQGVAEKAGESWKDVHDIIVDLSKQLGLPSTMDYDEAFRLGPAARGKIRPILVKLLRTREKKLIFANSKKLRGSNIYINDDLLKEKRAKKGQLRPKAKELRKADPGATVKLTNSSLFFKSVTSKAVYFVDGDGNIQQKTHGSSMDST